LLAIRKQMPMHEYKKKHRKKERRFGVTTYLDLLLGHELVVGTELEKVESKLARLAVTLALDHLDDGRECHRLEEAARDEDAEQGAVMGAPVMALGEEGRGVGVEGERVDLLHKRAEDGEHANAL
jgi:hypothetical protein